MALTIDPSFRELIRGHTGEEPIMVGESFNKHYRTSQAFIKVSRPFVLPFRAINDVYMAQSMHDLGVKTVLPLVDHPLEFVDSEGHTRWVTLWEYKTAVRSLELREGTLLAQNYINDLWLLPPPEWTTELTLDAFLHAAHLRLAGSTNPLTAPLLEAIEEIALNPFYTNPKPSGLLHGDLHNQNIMLTVDGPLLIDWESTCMGPKEWDIAQNLRYADPSEREEHLSWWLNQTDVDKESVDFYYKLRSLTSMTHFVANNIKNRYYQETIVLMGWESYASKE